jgi:HD superfamily phosphohydrolase
VNYFQSLLENESFPKNVASYSSDDISLLIDKTKSLFETVANHPASKDFWLQIVSLAGLLHDIGHGPWSHTFEFLELEQDFSKEVSKLPAFFESYYQDRAFMHEDISVFYVYRILSSLQKENEGALDYFLPVSLLINRKFHESAQKKQIEEELVHCLTKKGIKGGVDFLTLLSPLISGPFDVDRIDYIQRDGRNCGVSLGGIEWRRILRKLSPCLAERGGKKEVVLLSSLKNQHVLEDFIFTLFQMYAQVYLHPTIIGLEDRIRTYLLTTEKKPLKIDLDSHSGLTDHGFKDILVREMGLKDIDSILHRRPGFRFSIAHLPKENKVENSLKDQGYSLINVSNRAMFKDLVSVFLYSQKEDATGKEEAQAFSYFEPWSKTSSLAGFFEQVNHAPRVWIRAEV